MGKRLEEVNENEFISSVRSTVDMLYSNTCIKESSLSKINVIDLECCCWRGRPAGDIIEIGIAVLNTNNPHISATESIIVNPIQDSIETFCTELTTLTPEFVAEHGMPFRDACLKLQTDFNSRNHLWASYGDFDRLHFEKMCAKYKVKYPFGRTHLNIKNLVAVMEGWSKEIGMQGAYNKYIGMVINGTHHRGIDDARNIAYILQNILEKYRKDYNVC